MLRMRIGSMLLGLMLLLPVSAWAWDFPPGQTGPTFGKVDGFEIYNTGNFAVVLTTTNNPNNYLCSYTGDPWGATHGMVIVGVVSGATTTTDGAKALLASLIAAKLAGKTVTIFATTVGTSCVVGAIDVWP